MTSRLILILYAAAASAAQFEAHTIASDLKGGYQVVVADVNGDGKPDLIAVASGQPDLVWYENPSWTRHVIATGLARMINVAPKDLDGDGIPEIAVAYEFSQEASKSAGIVAILHHNGDPRKLWTMREIDRLPTSHRLRWASENGKDVLINAPLTTASAEHVPLVFYRPGEWKRETISEANAGVQHGVFVSPHGGGDHLLTASFSGLDHYQLIAGKWVRREINRGDPSPCPKCGSSDVTVGYVAGREFIASIEPWHGNQVAVYFERNHQWPRQVIDEDLTDGHTILMIGNAIVAGFRGNGGGVRLYERSGEVWRKTIVEDGTPASSCAAMNLDLVCIGGTNLTLYSSRNARIGSTRAARRAGT